MQIGPLSFPPSNLWSLCVLTAKLAVTIKAWSGGQLAKPDKDKKRRDGAGPRWKVLKTVWVMKEGFDSKVGNMKCSKVSLEE